MTSKFLARTSQIFLWGTLLCEIDIILKDLQFWLMWEIFCEFYEHPNCTEKFYRILTPQVLLLIIISTLFTNHIMRMTLKSSPNNFFIVHWLIFSSFIFLASSLLLSINVFCLACKKEFGKERRRKIFAN